MNVYVKKYFWLVPVTTVVVSAYFGAIGVNSIIESRALSDSSDMAEEVVPVVKTPKKKSKIKSKDGSAIAIRNMFCSTCTPVEEEVESQNVEDSDHPPITELPLRLVATNISTEARHSFATIQNTSSDRQGAYEVEQSIPGGGPVVRISAKYVDFENTSKKRVERLNLLSVADAPKKVASVAAKKVTPKAGSGSDFDAGINTLSDTEFELDKKMVDKILEDPSSVIRGARVRPHTKDGKVDGFRLYAIRPNSLFAKLGLRNGDTLHSVNGMELDSLDGGLKIFAKLRTSTNFSVNVTRRGKPVSLSYTVK